ncbi:MULTISPECIES: sensor histidine kinase [Xanthomonas]|nr:MULTISPECIES: histidine kinase [Xanthomonas]MBO9749520.1 histidine kinase [Xanthomonas phaseoli pv. dieffenbachiae]MBO9855834.1 histidine kinase [Xanthomonas sp. A1809]MBZ2621153.1 histidine kinase [Xanthomonas perforans]MBB5523664.1 LytS/YehU family sensor histidine kinase [Xanthomonas cannabis]MBO9753875.1 histidine kinase [Xanthomonas phaseoli pv. dieffenbachiae]
MPLETPLPTLRTVPPLLNGRRVATVSAICILLSGVLGLGWDRWTPLILRVFLIGSVMLLTFGLFERWPKRLPSWLARWVLQVVGVGACVLPCTLSIYLFTTLAGSPPFWEDNERVSGFLMLTVTAMLVGPWVALAALVRQKDALARHQALSFEMQRVSLERQALDAQLQLLQRQVAPHFLFNTLANVQSLIEIHSPQAPVLMRSLIAYLRAAVPRLNDASTTLAEELALTNAYLELMHMRMPDRLSYSVDMQLDPKAVHCPSLMLLTLVENAIKHGIDPCEDGGQIEIKAWATERHWRLVVEDTGAGLGKSNQGLGTGLTTLRDRLTLSFGDEASLTLVGKFPRGTKAEVVLPFELPQ